MDEIEIKDLAGKDLPFFARFLEGQMEDISEEEAGNVAGGKLCRCPNSPTTRKYPSDREDGVMTKKYPSDSEDSVGGTKPPIATTLKYPSDSEDGSGGGMVMTLKYPSDNEDTAAAVG
jgi:hypothetical protein